MWRTVAGLFVCAAAFGQTIVDPARISSTLKRLAEDRDGVRTLDCDVTEIKPRLDFSFRFQAGYLMHIPLRQFTGSGHIWAVIIKITPEGGDEQPVYFATRVELPPIPQTKLTAEIGGGYLMGEGKYRVEWTLVDNKGRVCRKDWDFEARLGRSERTAKVSLPPNTLSDFSLRNTSKAEIPKADMRPIRITVLLNVAPLSLRRTRLRQADTLMLISALSSLLERLPTEHVRLVMFNLDQQTEIFRQDGFTRESFNRAVAAINKLELGSVNIGVLENQGGHLDLLMDLVNQEVTAEQPSDVVVFLGPSSRYWDKIARSEVEKARDVTPRFFYFRFQPFFRRTAAFPDSIQNAVGRLKGKTFLIHSPGEFAKAIEQLEASQVESKRD